MLKEPTFRVCPRCNADYTEYPSLSRADNTTKICSICGMLEALEVKRWSDAGVCKECICLVLKDYLGKYVT